MDIEIPRYQLAPDGAHIIFTILCRTRASSSSGSSWTIQKRYSEIARLHADLGLKSDPRCQHIRLPPKHLSFSWQRRSTTDPELVEQRRAELELYLQSISKTGLFQDSPAWKGFLDIPSDLVSAPSQSVSLDSEKRPTSEEWIIEYTRVNREIASVSFNGPNTTASGATTDTPGLVIMSRKVEQMYRDIAVLEKQIFNCDDITDGEATRRSDMLAELRDNCERIGKYVAYWQTRNKKNAAAASSGQSVLDTKDRQRLLGSDSEKAKDPGSASGEAMTGHRSSRKFGARETSETLPLDNTGLLQLQASYMEKQDANLDTLGAIVQKQKIIGAAIGNELDAHNEILAGLDSDLDRVSGKVSVMDRRLGSLFGGKDSKK